MDGASRRIAADRGRRAPQRTRRSAKNSGAEGEQRRLLQLAVSVALFLLVYIGRGVFPAQLEAWRTAASANVDLKAAFQRFGTGGAVHPPDGRGGGGGAFVPARCLSAAGDAAESVARRRTGLCP